MNLIPPIASRSRRHRSLLIALAALIPMACGSSGPTMVKVRGRVTYQGKPVPKGTVSFKSTQPDRRNATGQIDSDGYYTLQTEVPGDGAEVGAYYVAVSARDSPILDYTPPKPIPPKFLVPEKFENPETSGLLRSVTQGGGAIDLELND